MYYKILSSVLLTCVLTGFDINAFAVPSVRSPNIKATTPTTARTGTLRTQQLKTNSATNTTNISAQKDTTADEIENETIRIPIIKNNKGLSSGKIKDNAAANQTLNQIDSRINELTEKLNAAEATQNTVITESNIKENIESVTYTKDEINALIAESEQKELKIDERGNWIDPNGNLIAVPEGAIVIGPNDITIVDGKLSTTSTNPIQNKVVTNALNEKQEKSTNLSFGNANGGWTHVSNGSDYIELYTNPANAKEIRIRPTMITNSLENMENEDQLITAGAVQEAIAAITTNLGGGTQPSPYFNLINLQTIHGGLVQRYTYETNASESEILDFALNVCGGNFSDKWCSLCEDDHGFAIFKRQEGYNVEEISPYYDISTRISYAVNLPDGISPQTYVNEYLCANQNNTCQMVGAMYMGPVLSCKSDPVHYIDIDISNVQ